jgi:putative transposase
MLSGYLVYNTFMGVHYAKNTSALFSLKYHIVFCPKYRRPVLVEEIDRRFRELLQEKAREIGVVIHSLEVMPDHVHLFVEADPTQSVAEILNSLKGYTSNVLRREFKTLRSRLPTLWSRSYYAGTVGHVSEKTVRNYIASQKGR